MELTEKIKKGFYAYTNLYLLNKKPTIVYTPGRVGSISMIYALRAAGVYSFKVEWLEKELRGSVHFVNKHIINQHKPAKIISLVRDPIEILISLYFSKLGRGHLSLDKTAVTQADQATLEQAFLDEIVHGPYFEQYLCWFESEFTPHLGVNVYAHPFDTDKGAVIIPHDTYPTLIMRSDLPNTEKEIQVKSFLDLPEIHIESVNIKAKRSNGDRYQSFKKQLKLSPEIIDQVYNLPYAKHFFSMTERSACVEHWSQ